MLKIKSITKPMSLIASLVTMVSLSACNAGSSNNGVNYATLNYANSVAGSSTLITGIRGVNNSNNVYITGIYAESTTAPSQGLLYTGAISGGGSWQILNYPNSSSTQLYGPDNGNGGNNVSVVGSYTTFSTGNHQHGLLYQGPATGGGIWSEINPSSLVIRPNESIIEVFMHSNNGGLAVGNFDTNVATGRAFIYNIMTNSYSELIKPGAVSITAYGIWYNGNNQYTIAGGYSDADNESGISIAYLVDYNLTTGQTSNWQSYTYQNLPSQVTHFEGITSDGNGGYNLSADTASSANGYSGASFVHVTRNSNGSFNSNASWTPIGYPNATLTSGNTVYQNYVLGIYLLPNQVGITNAYVATIH